MEKDEIGCDLLAHPAHIHVNFPNPSSAPAIQHAAATSVPSLFLITPTIQRCLLKSVTTGHHIGPATSKARTLLICPVLALSSSDGDSWPASQDATDVRQPRL